MWGLVTAHSLRLPPFCVALKDPVTVGWAGPPSLETCSMMCLRRQGILQAPPLNVHSIYQLLPFSLQGSGGRVSTIHIFYRKTKLRIF